MNILDEKKVSIDTIRKQKADGKVKVQDALSFRDAGISLEEARRNMLAAGETPRGMLVEVAKEVAKIDPKIVEAPIQAAPSRVERKTPTQARLTLINRDGTDGESQIITARSTFELNQLIQKNHGKAQQNKRNIRVELIDPNAPAEEITMPVASAEEIIEAREVMVAAEPVVNKEEIEESPTEVLENNKFRCEIKQDDGEWVAEVTYKTGGGVERFTAPSRKALNMKLLEGKAHATLRVREAIRREKYGVELDQTYTLPDYMTQEAFDALPEPAQRGIIDAIAMNEAMLLHKMHPEFYITEENSDRMQRFLKNKNLPFTVTNLTYAYEELAEADELETRPVPEKELVPKPQPPAGDSAAAAPIAQVASAPVTVPASVGPVRKRGTTGLMPTQSSAVTTELETVVTEEAAKPRELSEAELRNLPLSELKEHYKRTLKPLGNRRF